MVNNDEEKDRSRSEADGEEARLRGRLSILNRGWNREKGEEWAEQFVAREAKRTASLERKQQKAEIIKALRRELNSCSYCVTCGNDRHRDSESNHSWTWSDQCNSCRDGKVHLRNLQVRHCRYCNATSTRDEVLAGGKSTNAWTNGNRCNGCVNARSKIEKDVRRLLQAKLAGG